MRRDRGSSGPALWAGWKPSPRTLACPSSSRKCRFHLGFSLVSADQPEFLAVRTRRCGPKELLRGFRNHWSAPNSLHQVKDRSWDEDVHTLRRPGLGEVYATLVNTALNALRLEEWFPLQMSMPLRAKTCAFRPMQTIARLCGQPS